MRFLLRFLINLLARRMDQLPERRVRVYVRLLFGRTWRQLERATRNVEAVQRERLLSLMRENADTEFGREHGFAEIESVDDFRKRVPIREWDDFAPWVERMVAGEERVLTREKPIFYASTSGTTGRRKLIPVTPRFVAECKVTNRVLFRTSLMEMPRLIGGKRLSMRSPSTEEVGPNAQAGSITVALTAGVDDNESALDAVPAAVYRIRDFTTRYRLCLRFALQEDVRVVSAVNPSTLLLFAQTLAENGEGLATDLTTGALGEGLVLDDELRAELEPRARVDETAAERVRGSIATHGEARMRDVFPALCGLVCWKGGSAPWYLSRLPHSYGTGLPVLDYGYAASEGMFGAPLSADGASSAMLPHGHFYELMPEADADACRRGEAPTVLLHEAQPGHRYFVVVTTGAGLYRYDMNDVVEVTGRHNGTPLVAFRHKGGNMSSLTGEKLGESHVVRAMDIAHGDAVITGFVLAPSLPDDEGAPRYLLAVDAPTPLDGPAQQALATRFDEALMVENEEYEAKRKSLRLSPVQVVALPPGAVARHRERRVAAGAPDAHVKVPHLSPDGALLLDLGVEETAPDLARTLPARRQAES